MIGDLVGQILEKSGVSASSGIAPDLASLSAVGGACGAAYQEVPQSRPPQAASQRPPKRLLARCRRVRWERLARPQGHDMGSFDHTAAADCRPLDNSGH